MDHEHRIGILDVSDECLLHIFQYVDSTDLFHLSSVCQKFSTIVLDEYLWTWADGRARPNVKEKLEFMEANIHKKTRAVMLAGISRSHRTFLNYVPMLSSFKALSVLALEDQLIHGALTPLLSFPPTLEELSLRHTYVTSYDQFFYFCSHKMTSLRVLCLDWCTWFDSQVLLPISKLPRLEILSFYLCKQLTDNEISYICLAGGYGFKKLKCLDVRFTDYGNELLNSFCRVSTLGELYFQNYGATYEIEVARRKMEMLSDDGNKYKEILSYIDEVNDLDVNDMKKKFGDAFNYRTYHQYTLSDSGIRNFRFVRKNVDNSYVPPKSVLYKRPYGKCRCKSRSKDESKVPISPEMKHLQSKIETLKSRSEVPRRHFLEVRGEPFVLSAPPRELQWSFEREPITDEEIAIMDHRPNRINLVELVGDNVIEVNVFAGDNTSERRTAEEPPPNNEPRPSSSRPTASSSPDPRPSSSRPPDNPRPTSPKTNPKRPHPEDPEPASNKRMRVAEDADEFHRLIKLNWVPPHNINILHIAGPVSRNTTSITHLSLRGYRTITDLSLDHLSEMNLELLDVTGTAVSKEGVESFRQANPDCRVLHESACQCVPNLHF